MTEQLLHVIEHAFFDTLPVVPVLFAVYFLMEYFWHKKALDLLTFLRVSGKYGVIAATLFGLIPQCGMSVFFTSLYLSRKITAGALVANYLATSDEAIPIMLASGGQWYAILYIIGIKVLLGITAGYIIDHLITNRLYDGPAVEEEKKDLVHIGMEKTGSETAKMLKHSITRTLEITGWVFGATLVLGLILEFAGTEGPLTALSQYPLLEIPLTALFGLIPNCAASIAIATGYIQAGLSFSAAIAGLSAGAGFGPILLVKQGRLKSSFNILVYTLTSAIAAGLVVYAIDLIFF
ncbi:MAG: arsenic efflux protein [Ignavibacteriaceae bacterium]|nr:arsenic efflux protein [Ignavibacteriaceae bacterium]